MEESGSPMIRKMKQLSVSVLSRTLDDYKEQVIGYTSSGTAEMAISLITGTTSPNNNIITQSSTHVGISSNKSIAAGDKLVADSSTYVVDYAVLDGRYAMYYLRKEE